MPVRNETGKSGSIHHDGSEIHVTSWNASDEADWQETTNSGSGGYYEDIPGTLKCSGSFAASFDLDNQPIPDLKSGTIVLLQLDYEDGNPALILSQAGIDSFEVTSEAKGLINFTCNWHSIGSFTWES